MSVKSTSVLFCDTCGKWLIQAEIDGLKLFKSLSAVVKKHNKDKKNKGNKIQLFSTGNVCCEKCKELARKSPAWAK